MTTDPCSQEVLAMVAVSDATIYYDKLYTYRVPALLEGHIFVGSMVLVPFGMGRAKPRTGVVVRMETGAGQGRRLKEILDAAPAETRLTDELLAIVEYLKNHCFCTWIEAVRAVIPRGAQYTAVKKAEGWQLEKKLERISEFIYRLVPQPGAETAAARKLTEKQQSVLQFVQSGAKTQREICLACNVTPAVPLGLVKRGLLEKDQQDKRADVQDETGLAPRWQEEQPTAAFATAPADEAEDGPGFTLSPAQQQAAEQLVAGMNSPNPKPALLYGVTGSGKTPVFIHLIQHALNAGRTALVLVPEIGLTSQMLGAMRAAFGQRVAVQHSGLSATERVLQWRSIQRGEATVVVGTRSAVFAPLDNLGLVVIDEEQERTYQSENAPRYNAVEVARRRAARHGALLLLASATPSIAGYYYAKDAGRYQLVTLTERYGNLPLPQVEMVDMGEELMAGNSGALSRRLADEIEAVIGAGRQVILLLNKRGYHRVALCRSCGEAIKCTECSVPMVYHRQARGTGAAPYGAAGYLACHYCGRSIDPAPAVCPECGGELRYAGFGTQRLEEELAERLPKARVLRMDMDTTTRKGSHGDLLARFAAGEADILVGTQMVAKGLDFEKVSLVGVVGIDSLLFGQGYRAYEQVFSLVTQVVGRSGRAMMPGRAIIQTVEPEHPVLQLAARQDYDDFYQQEIGFRKMALYPPFCTICVAGFVSAVEADAAEAATGFSRILSRLAMSQKQMPLRLLGPAPMQVARQGGAWRYRLTIKCRGDAAFRKLAWQALDDYNKEGWAKKTTIWLDFYADG